MVDEYQVAIDQKNLELMKALLEADICYDYTTDDRGGTYAEPMNVVKVQGHSMLMVIAYDRCGYVLEEREEGEDSGTDILDQVSLQQVLEHIFRRM